MYLILLRRGRAIFCPYFAEAIKKVGCNARALFYEGQPHFFFKPGTPYEIAVLYEVKEHLKKVFTILPATNNGINFHAPPEDALKPEEGSLNSVG